MTTFTQIPGGEKPCISLNPKNVISKIEPESKSIMFHVIGKRSR